MYYSIFSSVWFLSLRAGMLRQGLRTDFDRRNR